MFLRKKNKVEIIFYIFLKFILNKIFSREGDVLPAHILKKIDGNIFESFAEYVVSYNIPVIFVTGTNGKTTTANLIAETFKSAGKSVCANSNGANMSNGIFGAILDAYKLTGIGLAFKFSADFIIIEVDEKVFPYISSRLRPDVIVITNFYRDQLDRYGEVNATVFEIKKAVKNLSGNPLLVLPSFEPLAAFIGHGIGNPKIYYGLNKNFFKGILGEGEKDLTGAALSDALTCPNCGNILFAEKDINRNIFLLEFKCEKCGFANSNPDIYAGGNDNKEIKVISGGTGDTFGFKPVLTGDYNIANYLAAYSVLKNHKINNDIIAYSFENFQTKFGRSFKKTIKGIEINIDLVKNPTGFNRVLEKITQIHDKDAYPVNILFAFSDRDADGRDVSWIWDVEFEKYVKKIGKIIITGLRPFDLAVRLKAAGMDKNNITVEYNLKKSIKKIFQIGKQQDFPNKKIFILPTYTELLKLKKYIM
ncbi:MAG: MurT ligase domain-containing protein [bacterium]